MKKPLDFRTYKLLKKLSYNDMNRWYINVYKNARQDGIDEAVENGLVTVIKENKEVSLQPSDCEVALDRDSLYNVLKSVKGVGDKLADNIINKLLEAGVDSSLWEVDE